MKSLVLADAICINILNELAKVDERNTYCRSLCIIID